MRALSSVRKHPDLAPASRSVRPSDMLARLAPLRARFGVARLGSTTRLDRLGIETATAIRSDVIGESISVASGKGWTRDEAQLTALAEALERFAAEPRGRVPTVTRAAHALEGAIAPNRFPLGAWTLDGTPEEIDWCRATPLAQSVDRWVPAEAVFFPYSPPANRRLLFAPSTTGIAVGATLTEAALAGLLECVERDAYTRAVALVTRGDGDTIPALRSVDLGARAEALAERVRRAGDDLILRDLTHDLGVPTVMALILRDRVAHAGVSTHLTAEVAAERAIFEAAQSRATDLQGAREDLAPYEEPHPWFLERQPGLSGAPPQSTYIDDMAEEVETIVDRLSQGGISTPMLVDLSLPDVEANVARVIVPTLEHWALDPARMGARVRRWLSGG